MQARGIYRTIERPAPTLVDALAKLDVASVHESMTHDMLVDHEIRSVVPGLRRVGPAITAATAPGDNLAMHMALHLAEPGDFVVIGSAPGDSAVWGGLTTEYALARNLAGVVADGSIRDATRIRELGLGVWARRILSRHSDKKTLVGVNVPVMCGGVIVRPGDIIMADDDGVLVLPPDEAEEACRRAEKRMQSEDALLARLSAGQSPFEIHGMQALIDAADIPIYDHAFDEPASNNPTTGS
jgi:4-hydroxy-4-methyl-2-oxoglutarate aldolase